jgi:hypothetical protein
MWLLSEDLGISMFYRCHKFLLLTKPSIRRSKSMRWTPDSQLVKFALLTAEWARSSADVPGGKAGHKDEESLP